LGYAPNTTFTASSFKISNMAEGKKEGGREKNKKRRR
jgi:hypothetical protein